MVQSWDSSMDLTGLGHVIAIFNVILIVIGELLKGRSQEFVSERTKECVPSPADSIFTEFTELPMGSGANPPKQEKYDCISALSNCHCIALASTFDMCTLLQLLQATRTGGLPWRLLAVHWMQDRPTDVTIDSRDRPIADFRETLHKSKKDSTHNRQVRCACCCRYGIVTR